MMSDRIIAPVTFDVRGVAKEDTWDGSWCELVWRGGRGARITETPEDAETIIGRWCAEEKVVRGVVPPRATGRMLTKRVAAARVSGQNRADTLE